MNIGEWSIRNESIVWVTMLLVAFGGFYAYDGIGKLEDPEFTIKQAVIVTPYPGARPKEVAEEVTNPIEKAAQQLGQTYRIWSQSEPGVSIVTVEIKEKYDKDALPQIWDELRRKVNDAQNDLPPGAGPSLVNDDYGDVYGIFLAITAADPGYTYADLQKYADFLQQELLKVQDVKKIVQWGNQEEVVYVEISRKRLAQLGIQEEEIYATLREQNAVLPTGHVRIGAEYIRIDPTGNFQSPEQMSDLLIGSDQTGRLIYLGEIATIKRGYREPPGALLRHNGRKAVGLGISTVQGGNVVNMGEGIRERLTALEGFRPHGVELNVISYQSDLVEASVSGFVLSVIEAVVIVITVLLVFMGLWAGLLIGIVLTLTVFATLMVMAAWGIPLERVSLGALIVALGMLVDNAIVVTEGMMVRIRGGQDKIVAAREVVGQNMWPLFGATLVAILGFGAIGLSQDSTGEICRSLFQVILISLSLSWLTSITFTPLLCYYFFGKDPGQSGGGDSYRGGLFTAYARLLRGALRIRWGVVIAAVAAFAGAMLGFGKIDKSFFPDSTRPQFLVDFWLPSGTDIRVTDREADKIQGFLRQQDGVTEVASTVGSGGLRFTLTYTPEKPNPAFVQFIVSVDDVSKIDAMMPRIRDYLKGNYPDAIVGIKKINFGPSDGGKIQARLRGRDMDRLRDLADQAEAIMRTDPGSTTVRSDARERELVLRPQLSEAQARRNGLTRSDVAQVTQTAFEGRQVGVYRESTGNDSGLFRTETRQLPILTRPPEQERAAVDEIYSTQIWSPAAKKMIPLRQVVSGFVMESEDPLIPRRDRAETITVHCDPREGNASTVLNRVRPQIEALDFPEGYSVEWGGEYESSQRSQNGLARTLPLFLIAMVFTVLFLFGSIKLTLIIWLTVPLIMIGVTLGLLLTGLPFGFVAILAVLSLSGMQIKNAIVLLDEINAQQAAGKEAYAAIMDSCLSRLRPVTMAALTTVLGMIPLVTDPFFNSMAVSVMAGLSFAAVLTLIVVPVLYAIIFRVREHREEATEETGDRMVQEG